MAPQLDVQFHDGGVPSYGAAFDVRIFRDELDASIKWVVALIVERPQLRCASSDVYFDAFYVELLLAHLLGGDAFSLPSGYVSYQTCSF